MSGRKAFSNADLQFSKYNFGAISDCLKGFGFCLSAPQQTNLPLKKRAVIMDVIGLGICWRTIFDYGDKVMEIK